MHPDKHLILGVHITDRVKHATRVQEVLTQYGCQIKTRIGLHDVSESVCSPNGLLLLEMFGNLDICQEAAQKLNEIEGVDVQQMLFDHAF